MTKNDIELIKRAKYIRSNENAILDLAERADTKEARIKLEEMADDAFRIHERIAFECYD